MKNIPCVELPNKLLNPLPKDGTYAVISYKASGDMPLGMDIFEWWAALYEISEGIVVWKGSSSSPANLLESHPVTLVILVQLGAERRVELDNMLSEHDLRLTNGALS